MRKYVLIDQASNIHQTIHAPSLKSARRQAHEWQADGSYHFEVGDGTIWVDTMITAGGENIERVTTAIDPPAPRCTAARHRWIEDEHAPVTSSPQGGGVLLRDHCAICGVRRRTDTYAQRPDTGERGLTSVAYFAPEGE